MIEPIEAMAAVLSDLASLASAAGASAQPAAQPAAAATGNASFSQLFNAAVERLDASVATAEGKASAFASGSSDIPLSEVMVSLEQANLALQMAANVRDKVAAAYSNVMNMQI